jgi:hypothetical protein
VGVFICLSCHMHACTCAYACVHVCVRPHAHVRVLACVHACTHGTMCAMCARPALTVACVVQPVSLSRREIIILYAETRILRHDPLYNNRGGVMSAGFARVFLLLQEALGRWGWRRSWGGAKPSHSHCHVDECYPIMWPGRWRDPPVGDCSASDPDYWKKNPETPDFDGFAEYDAALEARWVSEFAEPKNPLPAGGLA